MISKVLVHCNQKRCEGVVKEEECEDERSTICVESGIVRAKARRLSLS